MLFGAQGITQVHFLVGENVFQEIPQGKTCKHEEHNSPACWGQSFA